jgi:cytochrome c oxidase assembly protein subunit 15
MIVVGGATRLTDSGLSITGWQPLLGAIPPLNEADWHTAFEKYRQIPQYHQVNKGMSLAEFQFIYWWEWAHRFLGRFIGVAFALPLVYFWARGYLRKGLPLRLSGVLLLGGLQGAIGWYMVKSGLVDRIDVSQYRLALHLTVAMLILALISWIAFGLKREGDAYPHLRAITPGQKRLALGVLTLVLLQSLLGAFVAGLNAGLTYNTWPLMDGKLVPDGLGTLQPWYLNLFENITTVQFNHRMMAYLVCATALVQAVWVMRTADDQRLVRSALMLMAAVLAQAALGIWTLLAVVPLWLGLAHQAGAAIVLIVAVRHAHLMTGAPEAAEASASRYSVRPSMS